MAVITKIAVPHDALLRTFRGGIRPATWGSYQDCFSLMADSEVSLEEFVTAFYTSPVFRIERLILRLTVASPSTDSEARALGTGTASRFAAWYVGERTSNQLLMCDRSERTRSWFRAIPADGRRTLLQFGTAVATTRNRNDGNAEMSRTFKLLLGFHVFYSKALLRSAHGNLKRLRSIRLAD